MEIECSSLNKLPWMWICILPFCVGGGLSVPVVCYLLLR